VTLVDLSSKPGEPQASNALDLRPIRTKPSTPRTNGMAERFIRTRVEEWAYGMTFQTSDGRNQWLSRYLGTYTNRIGATSLSVISCPDSRCNRSRSLNDLGRKHT
jgi:transposase InsO family protein